MKNIFVYLSIVFSAFLLMPSLTFSQYTTIYNFPGGNDPNSTFGSLISDGTYLYGMSEAGGWNSVGTVFKIKPDGTDFEKLLNMECVPTGCFPHGSLISDGTYLY